MPRCSSCKNVLTADCFTKNKSKSSGYHNQCKACRKEYYDRVDYGKTIWKDPEVRDKMNTSHKKWTETNRGKYNAYMRAWNKSNRDYSNSRILAYGAQSRVSRLRATPAWIGKDHIDKISQVYLLAKTLTSLTGIEFEVDHIYPIQNTKCSGLHVWWNLQVLPMTENRSKGNKLPIENKISPRVSEDCFGEYLAEQFKMYADLCRI